MAIPLITFLIIMKNTIDTSASYSDIKVQAKTAIIQAGTAFLSTVKTVGLYRAALTLKSPYYDKDIAKASSQAYTLVEKWLVQSGIPKKQARGIANNSKGASMLAEKVLTLGLSETVYNAVPTANCAKASEAVTEETVAELNKIKPSKAGRLNSKAKDKFGISDTPKAKETPTKKTKSSKPKPCGENTDSLHPELASCLSKINKIKKSVAEDLGESAKLELKRAVLDLLHSLTPAVNSEAA